VTEVPPASGVVRFAAFEVDLANAEVRKHGFRIRLQDQPFRVLQILLEHPGELVTREELQRQIWPADTFVDFEKGLNNAVKRLRDALGDSAGQPRIIETHARRGYRFVAHIERLHGPNGDSARVNPEVHPKLEEVINKALEKDKKSRYQSAADMRTDLQRLKRDSESGRAADDADEAASKFARKSIRWAAVVGATMLVIGVAVGGRWIYSRNAHALTDKDTIVLADFTNTTGDLVFDGALRQGLAVQLEQSPFLTFVPDQRVQQTLRRMGQPPDAPLTPEIARDLCQRTQSAAFINGSIASLGSQYVLGLRAVSCRTGNSLLNRLEEARATAEEAQAKQLDSLELRIFFYVLAFFNSDAAGMEKQVEWAVGKPDIEGVILSEEADANAILGRLKTAGDFYRRSVDSLERSGNKELAAGYEADAAEREALFGNIAEARHRIDSALRLSMGRDVQYGAALPLALIGDAARAQELADHLGKRFPEDTVVKIFYLPTIRAQLALSRNDSSKAIEVLQTV
jgi:DNA-binding winged helix-turn-helix (wHTH) protein